MIYEYYKNSLTIIYYFICMYTCVYVCVCVCGSFLFALLASSSAIATSAYAEAEDEVLWSPRNCLSSNPFHESYFKNALNLFLSNSYFENMFCELTFKNLDQRL